MFETSVLRRMFGPKGEKVTEGLKNGMRKIIILNI
jgi:hypothetical protein